MFKIHYILFFFHICRFGDARSFNSKEITKIIGGHSVDIRDYPYQVQLLYYSSPFCGGSIISPTWILSAAHCAESALPINYGILAGTSFALRDGVKKSVLEIICHQDYRRESNLDNDIAVLRLDSPLEFQTGIQAVNLPSPNLNVPDGTIATVTGWGYTEDTNESSVSQILQAVNVVVRSIGFCSERYHKHMTDKLICTGDGKGGTGTCYGDSGGPLVSSGVQIGIDSFGYDHCGSPNQYDFYTNVSYYRNWITKNTKI